MGIYMKLKQTRLFFLICAGVLFSAACQNQRNTAEVNIKNDMQDDVESQNQEVQNEEDRVHVFAVKDLEEVRLNGTKAADFYITSTYSWNVYCINNKNQLYKHDSEETETYGIQKEMENNENGGFSLVFNNVVHVDCGKMLDYTIFLTSDGMLYGMGRAKSGVLLTDSDEYIEIPKLLMENVKYALCGNMDIVVLKNDGTVWTWGYNLYDKCGVPGQGIIWDPICVAQDVTAVWMGKIQINDIHMNWEEWDSYGYDGGYNDNLIIKKADGSLWACGKNIEGSKISEEQEGITYTHIFMPCEIVERPYIIYDGVNTYQTILAEYERAWKDISYTPNQWENVDITFVGYYQREDYELCYSLKDLTDDGMDELIIGLLHEGKYIPNIIYGYKKGEVVWLMGIMERPLTIYKKGVVKCEWGAAGRGYHIYYELQKYLERTKFLDEVSDIPKNWGGGQEEGMYYYRSIGKSLGEEEEITEEEFWDIRNKYETTQVELEWNLVEGFWNEEAARENLVEILSEDNVYDLGGHVVAYLVNDKVQGYENNWLVIDDLEKGKRIYLPNSFPKILDIEIRDFINIYIKYEDSQNGYIQEEIIPVVVNQDDDILEIYPSEEKVMIESPLPSLVLPKTVWEETISYGNNIYKVAFERIGLAYDIGSIIYGSFADYRLIVKDEEGNIISSQVFAGYPITHEEVYWLKDISGDGFPDVIMCTFYMEGPDRFTDLYFLIWNTEKLTYELKTLPWNKSMSIPVWNEELSAIIFAYINDDINMKMYTYEDEEWRLYGELIKEYETETEDNDIEISFSEFFYADDQVRKNNIKIVSPDQDMPWNDEDSVWCKYNNQNYLLFPGSGDWNTIHEELSNGITVWKYVRMNL